MIILMIKIVLSYQMHFFFLELFIIFFVTVLIYCKSRLKSFELSLIEILEDVCI